MGKTTIEWCTDVWNPVTGCTKVSQGCKNCYAERVFPRAYGNQRIGSNGDSRPRRFTDIVVHHDRLDQPVRWKKPRRIFVNSMSDLFHENVPHGFIVSVFSQMEAAAQHTFQILTKRPANMLRHFRDGLIDKFPVLPNVHLGVSCEDQETADERIPLLLQTPAAVRFVSAEPLLGPINLRRIGVNKEMPDPIPGKLAVPIHYPIEIDALKGTTFTSMRLEYDGFPKLDWVIVGGESGPNARPMHPDWARSLRDQCQAASVRFFFKQWGEWAETQVSPGGDLGGDMRRGHTTILHAPGNPEGYFRRGDAMMSRVGKKSAAAALDGREWKEFPA